VGNEKTDGELAKGRYLGKGIMIAGDIPFIGAISQDQILSGETSATITVKNIVSTRRIIRVWAIVHSPDLSTTPDNPITDLPTFDLTWNEQTKRYEGTYNGFTVVGTYTVTVYAMNEAMIISLPETTEVEQVLSGGSIGLQLPSDGASFGACSLSSPPTLSWSGEGFKGYEVQFSVDQGFNSISVKVKASTTQAVLSSATWKKVLMIPGSSGGSVYWRVMGRMADGTTAYSGVFSLEIGGVEAVGNPAISPTSKSDFPTLFWENNCGVKFKVWFGSDSSFTKKVSYGFSLKNPDDNGGVFSKGLTSTQWKAIRKLVNDVVGSTIFWYVELWDGLNRKSETEPMNFTLTD
jgi:hypothetical protein